MSEELQSTVLTQEEIQETVSDTPKEQEEVVLPSEAPAEDAPILGKFKSQEDLIKAYQELESKLGKPKEEDTTVQEPVQQEEAPKEEPKQEVDPEYEAYKQEKQMKEMLEPIGGLEAYKQALAQAKELMSEEEMKSYTDVMARTDDAETARFLAQGFMEQVKARNTATIEPTPLHSHETYKQPVTKGYATKSDMLQDMSDPRYSRDPSYRALVEAKVAKTDEAAWYSNLAKF